MRIRRMVLCVAMYGILFTTAIADETQKPLSDSSVGSVYGTLVKKSDIRLTEKIDTSVEFDSRDSARWEQMGRIHKAFGGPVMERFVEQHKIEVSADEVKKYQNATRKTTERLVREQEANLVTFSVQAQEVASLKMKIVVKGITPEPQTYSDPAVGNFVSGNLLVGANGELSSFVVMFDEEKNELTPPAPKAKLPLNPVQVEIQDTHIKPRISVCRPGQAISITNAGRLHHHLSILALKNTTQALPIPPGARRQLTLKEIEPHPIQAVCDIHPWQKAYFIVQKHAWVGVSNADGVLEIKDLPVGKNLVFRVWHEVCNGIDRLYVDDKPQELLRGSRWKLDLKPDVNDLGVVKISNKFFWNR